MKYFKSRAARTAPRYEVTEDNFTAATERKYPYEQVNNQRKIQQYGICPSCLNPVQLIGILHEIIPTPYGKHTGKSIPDLAQWNQRKYEYCPYASKNERREPDDEERLPEIDESIIELYDLLRSQFDRIVYILAKELGIQCASNFWRTALNQYLVNRAYCYPWLSEANLPYIFAYFGIRHQRLYKQRILVNSPLYEALAAFPDADFVKSDNISSKYEQLINKDGRFLNLYFRFTDHKQTASNGQTLRESMLFCVDDRNTGTTVYRQKIEFEESYFMNIVHKKENENKRQQWLLDIAADIMQPLE